MADGTPKVTLEPSKVGNIQSSYISPPFRSIDSDQPMEIHLRHFIERTWVERLGAFPIERGSFEVYTVVVDYQWLIRYLSG